MYHICIQVKTKYGFLIKMTPYKGKQITISSLTIWAYKNSKINLEFDSTQAMNLVKPRKTHQLLAQFVFPGGACEHPEHLLKNTLTTYQLAYNVHIIESKIVLLPTVTD